MGPKFVHVSHHVKRRSTLHLCHHSLGRARNTRCLNHNNFCQIYKFQDTAARTYGLGGGKVSENLVKINVYYTSLNENVIKDEINYDFEVR